jgi:hypothetical protein
VLGICAGVAYCVVADQQKNEQTRREFEAAKAVSVLPPGTEQAWLAYADRRIAATMRRQGSAVQVVGLLDRLQNRTTIISISTPYQISCGSRLGTDVKFGSGDDSITIPIVGDLVRLTDRSAEYAPQLGVHPRSIAATKLYETLCREISDRVQAIMAPNTATPVQP